MIWHSKKILIFSQKNKIFNVSSLSHQTHVTSTSPFKASTRRYLTFQTTPHLLHFPLFIQKHNILEIKSCTNNGPVLRPSCFSVQQLLASWLACGPPPKNESNRTLEVLLFVIRHLYTNIQDLTEQISPPGCLKAFDQLLNLPNFHVPVRCAGVVRHLPRAVWTCWKRESNFSLLARSAWIVRDFKGGSFTTETWMDRTELLLD